MEEKKADNTIINKNKIRALDSEIDFEKNKIKKLDDIEELFITLNKDINKCVELLGESIKGKNIQNKLAAVSENSKISMKKGMSNIEEERKNIRKNISSLINEKDKITSEAKKENKEKE